MNFWFFMLGFWKVIGILLMMIVLFGFFLLFFMVFWIVIIVLGRGGEVLILLLLFLLVLFNFKLFWLWFFWENGGKLWYLNCDLLFSDLFVDWIFWGWRGGDRWLIVRFCLKLVWMSGEGWCIGLECFVNVNVGCIDGLVVCVLIGIFGVELGLWFCNVLIGLIIGEDGGDRVVFLGCWILSGLD